MRGVSFFGFDHAINRHGRRRFKRLAGEQKAAKDCARYTGNQRTSSKTQLTDRSAVRATSRSVRFCCFRARRTALGKLSGLCSPVRYITFSLRYSSRTCSGFRNTQAGLNITKSSLPDASRSASLIPLNVRVIASQPSGTSKSPSWQA